ncbi:uncharacterized protein J3D65DRAFT_422155 [Phyllosticta citribraziliensis]|uniref:Uncharacterized protein n=1 Tax=Phyllosticta citribraziliensis TaxID=989973 RepID=A0ABR1LJ48_9PEZI
MTKTARKFKVEIPILNACVGISSHANRPRHDLRGPSNYFRFRPPDAMRLGDKGPGNRGHGIARRGFECFQCSGMGWDGLITPCLLPYSCSTTFDKQSCSSLLPSPYIVDRPPMIARHCAVFSALSKFKPSLLSSPSALASCLPFVLVKTDTLSWYLPLSLRNHTITDQALRNTDRCSPAPHRPLPLLLVRSLYILSGYVRIVPFL